MSDVNEVVELIRALRNKVAEIMLEQSLEYSELDENEKKIRKNNLLIIIENFMIKYRLVNSGCATREQWLEFLELYGEKSDLANDLIQLADMEDDVLNNANEVEALRNKKREFAIIKLGNSEFKDIHSDKCSVISSWLEALSDAEANYSQFVDVSHQLSDVLAEMIFDESGFREKRPAGKKKTRPRYSHEEIYAYDRKLGYKKATKDLNKSKSTINDARTHVRNAYTEEQIEDDYLEWYRSILKKFMSQCEKDIEQHEHDLLWNKRSLSAEKIEMINKNILKKRKELGCLSTETYKAAKERVDVFKKRVDTLKSKQSVK